MLISITYQCCVCRGEIYMCGRFFVAADDPELRAILKEIEQENKRQGMELPPIKTGMVFPTDYTAAKLSDKNKAPYFRQMRWGFSAHDGKGNLINARAETILEKPTFLKPAREARYLIPASYCLSGRKTLQPERRYVILCVTRKAPHSIWLVSIVWNLSKQLPAMLY